MRESVGIVAIPGNLEGLFDSVCAVSGFRIPLQGRGRNSLTSDSRSCQKHGGQAHRIGVYIQTNEGAVIRSARRGVVYVLYSMNKSASTQEKSDIGVPGAKKAGERETERGEEEKRRRKRETPEAVSGTRVTGAYRSYLPFLRPCPPPATCQALLLFFSCDIFFCFSFFSFLTFFISPCTLAPNRSTPYGAPALQCTLLVQR
jgi:hypothetical protein